MSAADINRNIDEYVRRTIVGLHALGSHFALKMEGEAKVGAKWEDHTAHARQGLFGEAVLWDNYLAARIAHTMHYGIFLELRHQGRFAILEPTAKANAVEFFEAVARYMRGKVR